MMVPFPPIEPTDVPGVIALELMATAVLAAITHVVIRISARYYSRRDRLEQIRQRITPGYWAQAGTEIDQDDMERGR